MTSEIMQVGLADLVARKDQPRQHFDEEAIGVLASSIRHNGFIGHITVRRIGEDGRYEILAGHRRSRAAREAGLEVIPALVEDLDDQTAREFVLLDNLHREDLLPWEEGAGFAELVQCGLTVSAVGLKASRSSGYVSARIAVYEGAGQALRSAYLRGVIGLEVLEAAGELPDRDLAPVRCPRCALIHAEGTGICSGCQYGLGSEPVMSCGNPQAAAAKLCAGRNAEAGAEVIEQIKASYGLAEAPVQTSMGFDDVQIAEDDVRIRTELERRLAAVTRVQEWLLKNEETVKKYTGNERAAVRAQVEVVQRAIERIAEAVSE